MKRHLFVVGICLGFITSALAADPSRNLKSSAKAGIPPRVISSRTQLEALLLTPAKLDFEGRKQVTVREVLDQLHQQHHLSLRFDTPTLAAMLDKSSHTPAYHPAQVAASCLAPLSGSPAYCSGPVCLPGIVHIQSSRPAYPVAAAAYQSPEGAADAVPPSHPAAAAPAKAPASSATVAPAAVTPNVAVAPAAAAPQVDPQQAPMPAAPALPPVSAAPAAVAAPANPAPYYEPGTTTSQAPPFSAPASPAPMPVRPESPSPKGIQQILEELLDKELDIQTLDLSRVSIATVLRQALDAAPTAQSDESTGMPILMTNAALLDYLVEDDGLLITTRMKALSTRETRVYSIKHLQDLPAEQLAKTIRQSIRPWSWRSQINDLGEQLKGTPLPAEALTSMVKTGVQLVGAEVGVDLSPSSVVGGASEPKPIGHADEAKQMEMLGGAITNGLVTLAQSTLLALEMVHYAEPPTATIQTLGHKLIITQSQTAHREIAELLKLLADD